MGIIFIGTYVLHGAVTGTFLITFSLTLPLVQFKSDYIESFVLICFPSFRIGCLPGDNFIGCWNGDC